MVKALVFKGDKKPHKKRKRAADEEKDAPANNAVLSIADTTAETEDENWVAADALSDISGPVLLVWATPRPVACVSVDQLGRVFAQTVENLVEDEPATGEPHDVRQVWIANRVVGMERNFTFKGHHGRYLGCSAIGELSATREAVSMEETFRLEELAPAAGSVRAAFALRTTKGKYLTVGEGSTPPTMRGDVEQLEETARIYVRMQARFKPQHKVEKAEKSRAKISRKELEAEVGRRLDDDEVKRLKRARRDGSYHETMLDVKVKGKHDKYA